MSTDITVTTTTYTDSSRWWLLFEAYGNTGPVPTKAGQIDFSLFTANTHYPNGFLPSGLVLGRVTTGSKLGPYSDAASDGRQTAVGLLYNNVVVPTTNLTQKATIVFISRFAVVSESRLPTGHGLDANGKADLKLIDFDA